jgi:sugar transferase EpsL
MKLSDRLSEQIRLASTPLERGCKEHRRPSEWQSAPSLYLFLKRSFDLAIGSVGLIIMAIPMAFIAALIRISMGAPVIFRQVRPGLHERMFPCLKFRSMTCDRDAHGKLLPDHQRITWLGAILRRTSLDELPQLWNIVRGDLSLIGPRPLCAEYLSYYTEDERRRHSVRPGLTGFAQIHGRNYLSFEERLKLDVWYVNHMNWWLDFKILLKTVCIVISQRGYAADAMALNQERALKLCTRPNNEVEPMTNAGSIEADAQ